MDTDAITDQNRKNRQNGKYGERRLAKRVNGVVVGRSKAVKLPDGSWLQVNCQRPPDVVTPIFSFESKWLTRIPANIRKIMTQAVTNAPEGLTPVGVIGDRTGHEVYYVMMEKDFLELHVGDKK